MRKPLVKSLLILTAAWSALLTTAGCASGGYKLTRQYAGFVNRQPLILRIVLYILTSIVFAATLLIDSVIFNTMDFWEGRVSQGTFEFQKDGKSYVAQHSYLPGTRLRQSHIQVFQTGGKMIQDVVLRETTDHAVEVFVDGRLIERVTELRESLVAAR